MDQENWLQAYIKQVAELCFGLSPEQVGVVKNLPAVLAANIPLHGIQSRWQERTGSLRP